MSHRKKPTLKSRALRKNGRDSARNERNRGKGRKGVCECVSRSGSPKKLYPDKLLASRSGGNHSSTSVWRVYACPESSGWHISSVDWDPWNVEYDNG